jgi:hypothetical protein
MTDANRKIIAGELARSSTSTNPFQTASKAFRY